MRFCLAVNTMDINGSFTEDLSFCCTDCDYTTYFVKNLEDHEMLHKVIEQKSKKAESDEGRKRDEKIELKLRLYKCAECDFWTSSKRKHEAHTRRHVQKTNVCWHCGFKTHSKRKIRKHFRRCLGKKLGIKF